jgi:hypothetical protein
LISKTTLQLSKKLQSSVKRSVIVEGRFDEQIYIATAFGVVDSGTKKVYFGEAAEETVDTRLYGRDLIRR